MTVAIEVEIYTGTDFLPLDGAILRYIRLSLGVDSITYLVIDR